MARLGKVVLGNSSHYERKLTKRKWLSEPTHCQALKIQPPHCVNKARHTVAKKTPHAVTALLHSYRCRVSPNRRATVTCEAIEPGRSGSVASARRTLVLRVAVIGCRPTPTALRLSEDQIRVSWSGTRPSVTFRSYQEQIRYLGQQSPERHSSIQGRMGEMLHRERNPPLRGLSSLQPCCYRFTELGTGGGASCDAGLGSRR